MIRTGILEGHRILERFQMRRHDRARQFPANLILDAL
jgi:hypothetical protein